MQEPLTALDITRLRDQHYNATIISFRCIHEELAVIRVRPDTPIPLYKAGQYTTIGAGYWEPRVPGCQPEQLEPGFQSKLVKRAYSIASSVLRDDGQLLCPEDEDYLEFYVVLVRDAEKQPPALAPRLFAMQKGSRLFFSENITGTYTLDRVRADETAIFMATGTGEAPHNKMLLELLRAEHRELLASVVCVRFRADLGYFDIHQTILGRVPNYRYIWLTTREKENLQNKLYIQDLIRTGELERRLGRAMDPTRTHVFLCGNPKMIGVPEKGADGQLHYPQPVGVVQLLEERGFRCDRPREPGNIHFEKYW